MWKSMGKLFSKRKSSKHRGSKRSENSPTADKTESRQMFYGGRGAGNSCPSPQTPVHNDAVVSLSAVQPGLCLSGSKDKSVVLYDYVNNRLEEKWLGHEREVTKVKYGKVCSGIFSASRDKTVKLWSRGNPHAQREYVGHDLVVSAIDLHENNRFLCTGSRDNTVRLWDVETAQCIIVHNIHRNLVTDVKFVPGTHLLVQTGEDKEVRMFDTRNLEVIHNFPRKQYIQMSCDVSPDGNYCLTCSNGFTGNGCEATLWDLRARAIVREYKGHTEAVEGCIFLPLVGNQLIATSSRDCSVRVWDMSTKECVAECVVSGSGPLSSIICYEDCSICVSSFNLGILKMQLSLANSTLHHTGSF